MGVTCILRDVKTTVSGRSGEILLYFIRST